MKKTILVIGTYDTKDDELHFIRDCILEQGGEVVTMDVSVLGDPSEPTDISKHQVAEAAGSTIASAIDSGDENTAMQIMARGASLLTARAHAEGRIDAMLALGGTMGTDLALDCARALPLGVPKYIVSTVSFSPLIPAERLSADLQMILWAGGLYGLNEVCRSSLSQAAGAVLGAAKAVQPPRRDRPVIGMMSLGSSCLKYMKLLKRPLEDRGFSVAVFHATGMGGMAFESLAREGFFACTLDLALPELGNLMVGSVINGGTGRLTGAGLAGIPQIVSPGCADLIDFATWQEVPARFADRSYHAHNRLIASSALTAQERRELVRDIAERLGQATAPVHVVLPMQGVEELDREGQDAHDPESLEAMLDEFGRVIGPPIGLTRVDAHINDPEFSQGVLAVLDGWIADGIVKTSL